MTIYLGDTNCDMLPSTNNDTKHLMKLPTKFNLVQLIESPIGTAATTETIIDHTITDTVFPRFSAPHKTSDFDKRPCSS